MHSLTACPECGLPAEITDRFSLSSTDGLVEHVALACVDGHYFRMPADGLSPEAGPLATGSMAPVGAVPADTGRVSSALSSRIGFSRLPGALGTVANTDSGHAALLDRERSKPHRQPAHGRGASGGDPAKEAGHGFLPAEIITTICPIYSNSMQLPRHLRQA
jgi:hypothetical protein